ncbi:hypothetical protein NM688_g5296 [Phlebia brevispora]|uniref:Uncharacterized protein n=1 Tax=Phlebia brevispora TaxID=194682 RepID=A0ACC1SXF0_9APHY|nr:hypothetical protein NM688_g5296 [Phlebia brevispora]
MEDTQTSRRPAWLTDDIADEWVSQDEDQQTSSDRSHAITDPSIAHSSDSAQSTASRHSTSSRRSVETAGTVCVREDVPVTASTPIKADFIVKGIFSPLALERMFEPPSPPLPHEESPSPPVRPNALRPSAPVVPSRLSQVYTPGDEVSLTEEIDSFERAEDEDGSTGAHSAGQEMLDVEQKHTDFQFTFSCPNPSPLFPAAPRPNALSTPGRPAINHDQYHGPHTDPRLRLFQLNYDTFTREHMSAMVDSMQLNTPSGNSDSAFSKHSMTTEASQGLTGTNDGSMSRLRSAKRLKLSPTTDFPDGGEGAAVIVRPQRIKDYVGESKSLMEKIKQAQDFSTISTVGSGESAGAALKGNPSPPQPTQNAASEQPSKETIWTAASSQKAPYSSLARQQGAAVLMEQIRQDMKRHKRLLSVDTEISERTSVAVPHIPNEGYEIVEGDTEIFTDDDEKHVGDEDSTDFLLSETNHQPPAGMLRRMTESTVEHELVQRFGNVSVDSQEMLEQFPAPPIVYITSEGSSAGPSDPVPATYTTASVRRKEDLTRFVSSSTASGTTLTANSAASFVKHQGPKFMMQITPNDIAHLPDRVGKMVFDRIQMKWIKAPDASDLVGQGSGNNDSEDPFKDIESIRGDDSHKEVPSDDGEVQDEQDLGVMSMEVDQSRIEGPADSEEDEEEAELTSFSCDYAQTAPAEVRNVARPQRDYEYDESTGTTGRITPPRKSSGRPWKILHPIDSLRPLQAP